MGECAWLLARFPPFRRQQVHIVVWGELATYRAKRIPGGKAAGKLSAEAAPTAGTYNIQLLTANASIK